MSNGATNGVNESKENGTMKNIACIISNSGIVNVTLNGKPYSIAPDHVNYKMVIQAIKDGDNEMLVDLVDIPKAVENYTAGAVAIVDGEVQYDGHSIHNSISSRILDLMREDMPFKFMVCFLDNLMKNPSYRAVNELYDFLEFANIPITDDGCFLAYKRVKENYMDIYSGKFDNSVGEILEMTRNMVDEDKNRTCSAGFHFCSLDYIPNFGAAQENSTDRVMIVKINPADVVAIPADYNNTKGRCCKYEVVAEYDGDWRKDAFTKPVHRKDGTPYQFDDGEYDEDGYDEDGYDEDGYDRDGYDADGYDCDGYDMNGLDREGYDYDGYDESGYNEDGYDKNGNHMDSDEEAIDNDPEDTAHDVSNAKRFYSVRNANGQPIRKGDNA